MGAENQIQKQLSSIILSALEGCATSYNKWRRDFIFETLMLFLSIHGRVNFLQLARNSKCGEQRFRQQFEKPFDFLEFNSQLVEENLTGRKVIAIDPSYIPKSGKKTPHISRFWSGCAASVKRGIEVLGIATVDIDTRKAVHLEAVQTQPDAQNSDQEDMTLIEWYLSKLKERAVELLKISSTVVCDAYFAKEPFITPLTEIGFNVVSRLAKNASLRYIHQENPDTPRGKGRPRQWDGKIDLKNLDLDRFAAFEYAGNTCFRAVVYSVALKRNILIVVEQLPHESKTIQRVIFSTDTTASPEEVLDTYHARFQIEFLFRDAKQSVALNHCQARSENKLHSHINFSLTALNIARIAHYQNATKHQTPFSIADIKLQMHNYLMLSIFIRKFGINHNLKKNHIIFKELILYGSKAA